MNATKIQNRTIYDCNLFQKGLNMIAMSKIDQESRDYDFRMNLGKTNFDDCNHIWFHLKEIEIIYSPILNFLCNHIWSPFLSRLLLY